MFKKKYFVLLGTLLLVFALGSSTTTLGYTFDNFITYCTAIVNGNVSGASSNWYCKTMAQNILNNETAIRNATNVNNYTCFVCSADTNTHYFAMYGACGFQDVGANYTNCRPNNIVQPTWGCRLNQNNIQTSYGSDPISNFTTNINWTFGLVTGSVSTNNRGYFNKISFINPQFTANFDDIITISQNNHVNALKFGYSVNDWLLGETTDFEHLYKYEFNLFDNKNQVWISDLSIVESNANDYSNVDGALNYNRREGNLYVISRYIRYQSLYWLNVVKYTDENTFTQENHYFYFLPPNAVIENGAIVSYGSGDFDTQDSTNQIIDNMNQEPNVEQTIGQLSSGDILNKFNYKEYTSSWITFMMDLFDDLKDTLLSNQNVSFTFPYMKTYITINSSDFTTPDGLIKGFCSSFLTFGYVVLIAQQIRRFYNRLQEGDAKKVLTWADVDEEIFMM